MHFKDICYDTRDIHEHLLDIFKPDKPSDKSSDRNRHSLTVVLHGGRGFTGGKASLTTIALAFVKKNQSVVATVNYPLGCDWAKQVDACSSALIWLLRDSNAAFYGYNPSEACIVAHEHSATIVLDMLLSKPVKVKSVVLMQPGRVDVTSGDNAYKWAVPEVLILDEGTSAHTQQASELLARNGIECHIQQHSFHHTHSTKFANSLVSTISAFQAEIVTVAEPVPRMPLKSMSSLSTTSTGSQGSTATLVEENAFNNTFPVAKSRRTASQDTITRTNSMKSLLSRLKFA